MMRPILQPIWQWLAGTCFVLYICLFAAMLSGCVFRDASTVPPTFKLNDREARQAGALALYAQGVLLDSGDNGSDTNAAKEAALVAFRHAAKLDPDNPKITEAIVQNLLEREKFDEALEALELFLLRNQGSQEMRLAAARVAGAADRPADAARHFRILLDARPADRDLARGLIGMYFLSGQNDLALALMRQQHALYQDDESALLPAKWAVHFSRDDERQDTAIECIETASDFSVDPKLRSAFDSLAAECWLNLGQTNKAMSCLLKAYRGNEAEPAPLIRLGRLWSLKPDAAAILGKRASLPSATHVDKMVLAAMRQALDDKDEAVRLLQEVYAMRLRQGYFPEPGFYLWMASLLESQRALPETEKWLTKALIVHPYSHELQNFLAYMWAEQGTNLGKAAEMINAALTAQPNNAAYLDTKGWVLYKEGRCYEALQYLLKAAEKDNQEPVILDHVGDTLLAVGRKSEAVSFWAQSHKFDPQPTVAEKLRRHGAPVPETTP